MTERFKRDVGCELDVDITAPTTLEFQIAVAPHPRAGARCDGRYGEAGGKGIRAAVRGRAGAPEPSSVSPLADCAGAAVAAAGEEPSARRGLVLRRRRWRPSRARMEESQAERGGARVGPPGAGGRHPRHWLGGCQRIGDLWHGQARR